MWKNGTRHGKQRYKCKACARQFDAGSRLNPQTLWHAYTDGKQTLKQLARQHRRSIKTIRHKLDQALLPAPQALPSRVNLVMDTTYFRQNFGVMVLMDSLSGQALSVDIIEHETVTLYLMAVRLLQEQGVTVQGITADGLRGLHQAFTPIPVQMCHYHQVQIVTRHLTRRPKSSAGQELRALVLTLKSSTEASFRQQLEAWYSRHQSYLNERSTNPFTRRSHYTHKDLRAAWNSLNRHLDRLFTFERFRALDIPKTTNILEGHFGHLKRKIRCHQGLSDERKIRLINDYFMKCGR